MDCLLLVSAISDKTDYIGYEPIQQDVIAQAHRMLLDAENTERQQYNAENPYDMVDIVTAESAPLVASKEENFFCLGGVYDNCGEGYYVYRVKQLGV